jgi:hypothetical protein
MNWRDAIKLLRKLGCTVDKKHRTGEYRIITPDGTVHLAGSTRKDIPGHVKGIIKKLSGGSNGR